jgi:hypothetical protein
MFVSTDDESDCVVLHVSSPNEEQEHTNKPGSINP